MLKSIIQRLESAEERFKFLEKEISSSDILKDQKIYAAYTKEYSDLKPLVEKNLEFKKIKEELEEAKVLMNDSDIEIKDFAKLIKNNNKVKIGSSLQALNAMEVIEKIYKSDN